MADSSRPMGLVGPTGWPSLATAARRLLICSCERQGAQPGSASRPQEDLHDRIRPHIESNPDHPAIALAYGSCNSNAPVLHDRLRTRRGCFASCRNARSARRRRSCAYTEDASSWTLLLSGRSG